MTVVTTLLILLAGVSGAQERRVALVVGNGDYQKLGRLSNPANDARDIAAALRGIGFEVDLRIDADLDTMEQVVVEFGRRLAASRGATGFFFYAGHGVESAGENYLIPARASIASESFLRTRSVATQAVLDEMQRSGSNLNVVVLDACRDNPFSWARSGSRCLGPVGYQPPGSIIAYATSAGSVAADGAGRNGTFTAEVFLASMVTPDLGIREFFDEVGTQVRRESNGRQVPWLYTTPLSRPFAFVSASLLAQRAEAANLTREAERQREAATVSMAAVARRVADAEAQTARQRELDALVAVRRVAAERLTRETGGQPLLLLQAHAAWQRAITEVRSRFEQAWRTTESEIRRGHEAKRAEIRETNPQDPWESDREYGQRIERLLRELQLEEGQAIDTSRTEHDRQLAAQMTGLESASEQARLAIEEQQFALGGDDFRLTLGTLSARAGLRLLVKRRARVRAC